MVLYDEHVSEILKIREIKVEELEQAFPVIGQLRTHLSINEYIKIVKDMIPNGYRVICLFENDKIVSYAGFARLINLYYGDHIWVYDLVTDENKRSGGYGKLLLSHIEKTAENNSLNCVALSSGLPKENAHRFYENAMGYLKVSYVFKKNI
jgi:GNAT superfamily N-acetyltransferase